MFEIAELGNLGANKNSNPSKAPGIDTITVEARRMFDKPAWEQDTKLGNDLVRETMGFLQAQNVPLQSKTPQELEGKGTLDRVSNK